MFERRLKILLMVPVICGSIVLARLYQLQVVHGESYRRQAQAALVSPRRFLPPLRGRILDRYGRTLVSDEPAHDVTVHYGVLSMNPAYLRLLADDIRRREPIWRSATRASLLGEVRRRIARLWQTLERVSPRTLHELRQRRDRICRSVERLRRHIWKARRARGMDEDLDRVRLAQELWFHPVLRDVSQDVRTRIELDLGNLPFVRVEPSVRRVRHKVTETLCHVLGRLGQVSAEMIRDDPLSEDLLAAYRPGDEAGVSGVERLGESILRGRRGFVERFRDGTIKDRKAPIDGMDLQLTIDSELQAAVVRILEQTVEEHPPATGASCVVIDVVSREILALASVPTYDRQTVRDNFAALRDDARRRPLLFRAVQVEYPPGSTIKPVALLAGLANHVIDPNEPVVCEGSLIPGSDKWHCWTHWLGMPGHGPLTAVEAIQHSCNVYFYKLGQRVNAKRLTDFYRVFVRGQRDPGTPPAGTGLLAERSGLIPSKEWMRRRFKRSFRIADGRNYAIGQGELQLTPLQVANMFATLATGRFRAPMLIVDPRVARPPLDIPGLTPEDWSLVRRGLYRCVNETGGSAYRWARMNDIEICGKTGTAQSVPRVIRWQFTFKPDTPGAATPSVSAPTVEAAREQLALPASARVLSRKVVEVWPPPVADRSKYPTHAWFAGYAPRSNPRIALAIVVEYGGSGGRTAGPVSRAVFRLLLDDPHGYFNRSTGDLTASAQR
ncbi:MAG: penicillin-binding transpeptidase domain-containing protein [Phycisphaerae bacterium]